MCIYVKTHTYAQLIKELFWSFHYFYPQGLSTSFRRSNSHLVNASSWAPESDALFGLRISIHKHSFLKSPCHEKLLFMEGLWYESLNFTTFYQKNLTFSISFLLPCKMSYFVILLHMNYWKVCVCVCER